jgi:amidophosphoribosyltransferase
VNKNGHCNLQQILEPKGDNACSFERIYFSRGSDRDIYKERKQLGEQLVEPIIKAVNGDINHTVFSYIPNTAEVAYYGMLDGFKRYLNEMKIKEIENLGHVPTHTELIKILDTYIRSEKVAWKDIKLRTFIAQGNTRNDLASHVYDITYGSLVPYEDNLVIIDDSIVRGTTLKESILRILDRLHPKKIIVVSSAPQIRYPDYYGIDMPKLEEFSAFRATVQLIRNKGMEQLITSTYESCKRELLKPKNEMRNVVRDLYEPFSVYEINQEMVEMLRPEGMKTPIEIVYQSIDGLHKAIPDHKGDWYFSGKYPTPGGTKCCLQAFIRYVETSRGKGNFD